VLHALADETLHAVRKATGVEDMWRLYIVAFGAAFSGILAALKVGGAIDTGWFMWVSIPLIVSLIIAFFAIVLDEGLEFLFD
jgi:hypothetical protein